LEIKGKIGEEIGVEVGKLRVLWEKKPVGDSKTLKDLVGDGGEGRVEMGVMVIGGVGVGKSGKGKGEEEVEPKVVKVGEGRRELATEAFWDDLKGFLVARLKDEREGERVWGIFRGAVDADGL
jgi:hypothetical protein